MYERGRKPENWPRACVLVPSGLAIVPAIANRALSSTIPKKNNDCSQSIGLKVKSIQTVDFIKRTSCSLDFIALLRKVFLSSILRKNYTRAREFFFSHTFYGGRMAGYQEGQQASDKSELPKSLLGKEVRNAELDFRQPPTPKQATVYS